MTKQELLEYLDGLIKLSETMILISEKSKSHNAKYAAEGAKEAEKQIKIFIEENWKDKETKI